MKISNAFMANHSVDFKSFIIEASDDLTILTININVNPTVETSKEKTVSYPTGEGFENVWFELKTVVVGVTAVYNELTGNIEVTKAVDWVAGDTVGILYSVYTTRDSESDLV